MATASAEGSGAVPKPILPQFHSPLLRLPGEIRNKIYGYALDNSTPLRVIGYLHKAPCQTHARIFHQFNELKHTCRQLRIETAWMGVSPADAFFDDSSRNTLALTSGPATRQLMYYKHDRQGDRFLSDVPFDHFVFFCRRNPQLEVAIFTQALRKELGCRRLHVVGAALQRVLRRKKLPFQVDAGLASEIRKMARHMHKNTTMRDWTCAGGRLLSKNIKVYPMDEYDEAEVRYSYPRKKKGFEDWVAQIREWYRDGI